MVLHHLSFRPDALEWARTLELYQIEAHHIASFFSLLQGMHRTLRNPEEFPSHLRFLVFSAVSSCNLGTISSILNKDTDALVLLKEEGNSMLHLAIA
jgi:hypothetical protein